MTDLKTSPSAIHCHRLDKSFGMVKALDGFELGSRSRSTGEITYVELYAPLAVPGGLQQGLFLSVPLLAQEEEVVRELAELRSRLGEPGVFERAAARVLEELGSAK